MLGTKEKVQSQNPGSEIGEVPISIDEANGIRDNISKNLDFLKKRLGIVEDKVLASKLGITPSQYSRIKKKELFPSVDPFLIQLHKNPQEFHCTVDEFLFTDLSEREEAYPVNLPTATYMKFAGLFQTYYFDTTYFKGRELADDADALRSGLVYIYRDPGVKEEKKYHVLAVLNMGKDRADKAYKEIKRSQRMHGIDMKRSIMDLGGTSHVYKGELELSEKHIFISLRYENLRDKVQMIFHRPSSSSEQYIGGLGMAISVSKGNSASPCVQSIALSEQSLDVSPEELASHLLLHYPNIKTYEPSEDLSDMLIQLYRDEREGGLSLTDEQKKMLVQSHMDKIVNETVERNLFRTEVISTLDDDDFYHYLKRARRTKV